MNKTKKVIVELLKGCFGYSALYPIKWIKSKIVWLIYVGNSRECNLCESKIRKFRVYGPSVNKNYVCPVCSSFGRHRFLWFILLRENLLPKRDQKVLHFAPEWCLERKLRSLVVSGNYIAGDLDPYNAANIIDITNIKLNNDYCDLIICSHVLEHILDDQKALSELHRVLVTGGHLLIQVPIGKVASAYENSLVVHEKDRQKYFGQSDHVRIYGPDILQRIETAKFRVRVIDARDVAFTSFYEKYEFDISEKSAQPYLCESRLYICTKI